MRTVKFIVTATMPETDSHGRNIQPLTSREIKRALSSIYGYPTFEVMRERLPRKPKSRREKPVEKPKPPEPNPVFLRNREWKIKYAGFCMEVYEKGTNAPVPLNNDFTKKELEFWDSIYPQSKYGYAGGYLAECIVAAHNIRIGKWDIINPTESLMRVRLEQVNLEKFD